jgi:LysM repeat protein
VALDLKALAKDKKAQVALAGGAVLGLVVLVRSNGSSEASDTAESTSTGPQSLAGGGAAGGGYLGGYDSTASDVYSNLETAMSNRLDGFGDSITDIQDQLKKLQQKPTVPKPPITPPKKPGTPPSKPKTPIKIKPPVRPQKPNTTIAKKYITIKRGDTLGALAKQYKTSVKDLQALNGIKNPNLIIAGKKLRVR